MQQSVNLCEKYPPSEPCRCKVCVSYCLRPGWWAVSEAERAIDGGFSLRMMLELSPESTFAVLSPAFRGNEGTYAMNVFSKEGCTFLSNGLCELFGTDFQPLECRYCHHARCNMGKRCHDDLARDWNTEQGKRLIVKWGNITGFWRKQGYILIDRWM